MLIEPADAAGLMDSLGAWVLHKACQQASQWSDALSISVNLSASQLSQGNLVSTVLAALNHNGLSAQRLNLEINESLLMQQRDSVASTIEQLSGLGVGIVMDDFGSGPASLSYLWKCHFKQLKIDRCLVAQLETDPHARIVVGSIISMAHALGLSICASGIEQNAQFTLLQELGCDQMQGFLLGKPAPLPLSI